MILYIDTHQRGLVKFGIISTNSNEFYQIEGRTDILLIEMEKKLPLDWQKTIQGILIISGPGPFSAIRGGILVSNLLARLLQVPLYGCRWEDFKSPQIILQMIKNRKIKSQTYIAPIYDAEPNITC